MAVLIWTVVPLALLHVVLWLRARDVLRFQLIVDILLVVVVGPALWIGGDLSPVRLLERRAPYTQWQWSDRTEHQPTQSDLVLQFHPWWAEARRQLLDGKLPLINPRAGGGMPLLAHGQIGLWAPVMAPVWALGPERGTTVMAFWKLEAAAMGAFLMLWTGWRLRWSAAAIGGIAWAAGAFTVAWLLVPLAWMVAAIPWLWWWTATALRRRARTAHAVLLGLGVGLLLGCGLHPEMASVAVGSALLAGLILHPGRWRRLVVVVLVAAPVTVVLAWPTLAAIEKSAKASHLDQLRPNRESLPAGVRSAALRQLLVPMANGHPARGDWRLDFAYAASATGVGAVVLVLAAAGAIRRRHRSLMAAALAALAVAAVLAFRVPPLDGLLVRIPPLDRMTLPRFAVLTPWSLSLMAALAVEGLLHGRRRPWPWRAIAAAGIVAAAVLSRPWSLAAVDGALVWLTAALALVTAALVGRIRWLVPVAAAELLVYAIGINPTADSRDRLPRPAVIDRVLAETNGLPGRIAGLGGMLPPNMASRYGLEDLRAYDPIRPQPFAELMAALGEPEPILGGPIRRAPPGLLGAWSVRFALTPPDARLAGWTLRWRDASAALWLNPRWLPEVRVVGRTRELDADPGWRLLLDDAVDLESEAVVAMGTPPVASAEARLRRVETGTTRVRATVDCDGPCLLLVARPWAPGWSARVDGLPAPVVRANLAGLGVISPTGEHVVELRYQPWSF